MSTHFVFSEYLDSVTKAFDLARGSYRLVLVLCATLVVFAIQGQPYKGSKKYLNHLVQAKADIDEKSGYIKGIDIVREIAHQGALGSTIAEAQSEKRSDLATLYAEILGRPDEQDQIKKKIETEELTEKEINDALAGELAKQYQFGVAAGLKVPVLDVVIERERIPALFSVLVAVFVSLTALSVSNLQRAFRLFFDEAVAAGSARKASDLLSMRGLGILLPHGGMNDGLQLALLWGLHLLPALLVAYAVVDSWSASAAQAKVVYCIGIAATFAGGAVCARSWVRIRAEVGRVNQIEVSEGAP